MATPTARQAGYVAGPSGRRPIVIVTRPDEDASRFIAELETAGLAAIASPLMRIATNDLRPALDGVAGLAFTSANGVRAFAGKSPARSLPVFAVGRATAEVAQAAGFSKVFVGGGDVAALADLVASVYGVETGLGVILHLAGTHRAGDLVAALTARSVPSARAVVYSATPVGALSTAAAAAIKAWREDDPPISVALFSPRTAKLFVEAMTASGHAARLGDLSAACLSEAVAAAAAEAAGANHWRRIRTAPDASAQSLLALIAASDQMGDADA